MTKKDILIVMALTLAGLFLWGVTRRRQDADISIERLSEADPVDAARMIDPRGTGSRAPNIDVSSQLTAGYKQWLQGATN